MLTWKQIADEWRGRCAELEREIVKARAEAKRERKRASYLKGQLTRREREAV